MEKTTYNRYEQRTYGVASFAASITFFNIAVLGGLLYFLVNKFNLFPGLNNFKDEFTFEVFTSFMDNILLGVLMIFAILLFLVASTFQIIWTKRIERITKRHTIPLWITFQVILGVAFGLGMTLTKTPYLFAIPVVTGAQALVRGIVGISTIDQKGYRPYVLIEVLFIILVIGGTTVMFILEQWVTLPWLITVISALVFNLLFNIYKYGQIIQTPEWQMLDFHSDKYKILVVLWLGFRLSSDWISTVWTHIIFNKRDR